MKTTIMKTTVLALFILSINFVTAQWETKFYVDDFGDPTEDSYETLIAKGTFSNSATTNSDATYQIVKDESSILIYIYEYNNKLAKGIDSNFTTIKIKKPSGEVVTFKKVLFSKKGYLFVNDFNFGIMRAVLKKKGKYTIIFHKKTKYSESSYKINLTL